MRPIIITLLLCSGLVLSACGQKGPLYLPDQPAGQESEEQKK
jgi:predicted small lipoprotein YifL